MAVDGVSLLGSTRAQITKNKVGGSWVVGFFFCTGGVSQESRGKESQSVSPPAETGASLVQPSYYVKQAVRDADDEGLGR